MRRWLVIALLLAAGGLASAAAGEADVVDVRASRSADGTWRFDVTVRHADVGWDHYADAFEVVAPDGTVLGTRTLLHPHVDEQPFTRSLAGVAIPDGIAEVTVRAHDSVDGYGGAAVTVTLAE
jgi:hypothetical protein